MTETTPSLTVQELDEIIQEMFKKRTAIDALEEEISKHREVLKNLEAKVTTALKELGRDSYKTPVGSLGIRQMWRVTTPKDAESKAKFFEFLKERGIYDEMISVNSQTLNAFYNREMEAAKEKGDIDFAIPGIAEPALFETVYMRKAQK